MGKRVMIVAAEASSDEYGSFLARELFRIDPDMELSGLGGPALSATGADLIIPPDELKQMALVGFTEVAAKAVYAWKGMQKCREHLRRTRPDLLILMDLPVFNFRLAKHAKRLGIRILYYFPPQLWAWRPWRADKMPALFDHLAVALPFEKEFYAARTPAMPVTFVGHPEMDVIDSDIPGQWPFPADARVVGVLPGSRLSEIRRHMPVLTEAIRMMFEKRGDLSFVLPIAPGLDAEELEPYLRGKPGITLLPHAARLAMRRADLLLACSGTATLQAAVRSAPMTVFYRTGRVNWFIGKRLMLVRHIGLPNLVHGGDLVPEFLQDRMRPETLAESALELLGNPEKLAAMRVGLNAVREKLGGPGASRRTAELAASMMGLA